MRDGFLGPTRTRVQALARYAIRRTFSGSEFLRSMIEAPTRGSDRLPEAARRDALRTDRVLRLLGVRCLWRAAVVTDLLRRRGIAARVGITVATSDPSKAHAECEVGGVPLRPYSSGSVRLR